MQKKIKFSTISSKEKASILKNILKEQKAEDILLLDLEKHSNMTDIAILASAGSLRHAKALADKLAETAKKENYEFLHTEGYESAQWILVDMNDVVVHLFQRDTRTLYDLEGLWHEATRIE